MKTLLILFCSIISFNTLMAQYTVNGSATSTNCHCYILTPNVQSQSGSVWNNNKIDLGISFDFQFNVFLGCNDASGADGIVFALQPISTSVGSSGGGLGFENITPSVGVTLDSYQNLNYNDPPYDHIDFQYNGNITHIGVPPPISATSDNVEDCNWHTLRISWDAINKVYAAYFDGVLRLSTTNDLVNTIFNGDPKVFWGFTGSTGGASNLQQFCTALSPTYNLLLNQKKCVGEPIKFYDSTISFAPLLKRSWDFGDGTPIDSTSINPVHIFTTAGDYTVLQTVIGIDSCTEINKQILSIGGKPTAAFSMNNACADSTVHFKAISTAQVNTTISQWNWDLSSGVTSTQQSPSHAYALYAGAGPLAVRLAVKTMEGCSSDTVTNYLKIFPRPVANFTDVVQACSNTTINFTDSSSYLAPSGNTNNSSISKWAWDFGNGQVSATQNNSISFATIGNHPVTLTVKTDSGCSSLPVKRSVNILPRPTAYFINNTVCQSAVTSFTDSSYSSNGDAIKGWWWNLGNGTSATTQHATATYPTATNINVQLVVKNTNNCVSDTLNKVITINGKPMANFGENLPLCENINIQFRDSSTTSTGIIQLWNWHFDNLNSSSIQNSSTTLTAGQHVIKLAVKNSAGCLSDTISKNILVNAAPRIGFSFEAACKNESTNFTGVDYSTTTISSWKWNLGDGTMANSKNTQHAYTTFGTYKISLIVTSVVGCSIKKDSSVVIYGANVFAGNDTIAAPNQPIQLQATGGLSYKWSPAQGLNNSTIANPIATNITDQTYYLKAFTPLGCVSYDTINIKIYDGPQLYLPTAFSPNGDGLNDVFRIFPVGIAHFGYFNIYDHYGKIIFSTKDERQGWDGTFKSSPQNVGTYVWIISGTDYKGNKILKKGNVVLVR